MYSKEALLKGLDWEDITDKLVWKSEGKLWCGYAEEPKYSVVVRRKGSSYMKINPMFATCGRGTFVSFFHGTYWLTTVKVLDVKKGFCIEKQRLLFLSSEKRGNVRDFGVHGC